MLQLSNQDEGNKGKRDQRSKGSCFDTFDKLSATPAKHILELQLSNQDEGITMDELIEKFLIVENGNRGLQDAEEGRTVSEAELDKRMEKWFA